MAPYFSNKICDAFTPRASPCKLGNYNAYAINVSSPSKIANGITFAKKQNIRLVIRNTSHEFIPPFHNPSYPQRCSYMKLHP